MGEKEERAVRDRMDILEWEDQYNVGDNEFAEAVRRVGNVAPGPDGITGNILKLTTPHIGYRLMACYNRCLREGIFLLTWKLARLVLFKKTGSSGWGRVVLSTHLPVE